MINENFLLKLPVSFKNVCKIYPPTVNEVLGLEEFNIYRASLTLTQEEIEDGYMDSADDFLNRNRKQYIPSPFEYLLITYYQEKNIREQILEGFEFFLKEPVAILPELEIIIVGKSERDIDPDVDLIEPRIIDANNYFEFQNIIRESMGMDAVEPPDPHEDPRVKRIKALGRKRERIKARRQKQSLGGLLSAICCMGIGLNPLNIGEISYASVGYLIETYQSKEAYDIDIRCLLAGADSKKVKPKYWIK